MRVNVIIPVFNDWRSCATLIRHIREEIKHTPGTAVSFYLVDDCSTEPCGEPSLINDASVTIITLNRNVGHQRAIALGLCYVFDNSTGDYLIVMDGDGEDKPEDIRKLLEAGRKHEDSIIFGMRKKRYAGFKFKFFYALYKIIFRILTGQRISFGNFCAIPHSRLKNLVYLPDIWNHFSGGIIRSRIPYSTLPFDRGKRYFGESKMNFIDLIIHGLSAVSVYTDMLAVRILIATFSLISLAAMGIVTATAIRLFTPFAIPGWASFVVMGFLIIIFQAFLISLLLLFNVLNIRTQRHFIPIREYKNFIA